MQVGWIKRWGYTEPWMYCEFAPAGPGRFIEEFAISPVSHNYLADVEGAGSDAAWLCVLDGVSKYGVTTSWMGFSNGNWMVAQGETDSLFSQIGKIAPSKLLFFNLKYLFAGTWLQLDLNSFASPVDSHYGRAEPNPGQLQVWTN